MTGTGCWLTWPASIADGGEAVSDFGVIGDQEELFGPVASVPTCWRTLRGWATQPPTRSWHPLARILAPARKTGMEEDTERQQR